MVQRLFGRRQVFQGVRIISLVQAHHAVRLGFDQAKPRGVGLTGDRVKSFVGFGKIVLARPGRGALQGVGQAVGCRVRFLDGLFVLHPRLRLVAHERVGIRQAELRIGEPGIDFQRRPVVLERAIEVARHAQDLGIRILRIG